MNSVIVTLGPSWDRQNLVIALSQRNPYDGKQVIQMDPSQAKDIAEEILEKTEEVEE